MKYNLNKKLKLNKHKRILVIVIIEILILVVIVFYILINHKSRSPLSELTSSDEVDSLEAKPTEQVSDNEMTNNLNEDNSVDKDSITVTPEGTADNEHLEFYDEFDAYNSSWDYFKGFILTEVRIDGALYYQLLNEEQDVKIIIDKTQENSVIYHNGKTMNYFMDFLITGTSTYTAIELCDITGEGEEELIISHCYTGTGFLETTCDVINLSDMTKYKIENYLNELSSRITVEPIKINEKSELICQVTDANGKITYGGVPVSESAKLSDFSYDPTEYNYIGVNSKDKCLTVSNGICLDYQCLYYLGSINSNLLFNPKANCFELSDDFNISLYEVDYNDNSVENDNNIENSEDVTQETDDVKHLEYYDDFDEYNSSQEDFKGFILSEVWIDGEAYYQFLNENKDIKIVVDQTQENAIIYHDGKSMDYDMGYLFDYAHLNTGLRLIDVTGEEEEELIVYHSYVGFGTYETYCDVINLSTMTQYDIEQYFDALCSKITVEPIKITEDNSVVCRITDFNGNVSYGASTETGSPDLSNYQPFEISKYASYSEYANSENKCLSVSIDIYLDDCMTYLCSISSDLRLNTNTNCFELSDDFEVSIDNLYTDEALETISPID